MYVSVLPAVRFWLKICLDDFFVGIGDINSTFLPKVQPLTAVLPQAPPGIIFFCYL
jgi:hypothetical protein